MKLTDKLREMSKFNAEVPEWAYGVIDAEITYCEDCKGYVEDYLGKPACMLRQCRVKPNDFCSKAVRL